jgi:hypothetical protein
MNQKHKQAFQELRQWCEKWDAYMHILSIEIYEGKEEHIYEPTFNLYDVGADPFHFNSKEIMIDNKTCSKGRISKNIIR